MKKARLDGLSQWSARHLSANNKRHALTDVPQTVEKGYAEHSEKIKFSDMRGEFGFLEA